MFLSLACFGIELNPGHSLHGHGLHRLLAWLGKGGWPGWWLVGVWADWVGSGWFLELFGWVGFIIGNVLKDFIFDSFLCSWVVMVGFFFFFFILVDRFVVGYWVWLGTGDWVGVGGVGCCGLVCFICFSFTSNSGCKWSGGVGSWVTCFGLVLVNTVVVVGWVLVITLVVVGWGCGWWWFGCLPRSGRVRSNPFQSLVLHWFRQVAIFFISFRFSLFCQVLRGSVVRFSHVRVGFGFGNQLVSVYFWFFYLCNLLNISLTPLKNDDG